MYLRRNDIPVYYENDFDKIDDNKNNSCILKYMPFTFCFILILFSSYIILQLCKNKKKNS